MSDDFVRRLVSLGLALAVMLAPAANARGPDVPVTLPGKSCDKAPPLNSCRGVRPGALHSTPLGQCTFNFLFAGSDGGRYMGSAGHCVLDEPAERVWTGSEGPDVSDWNGRYVGDVAYATLEGTPRGPDFALVRLKPQVKARPAMCFFGGPTGINNDITSEPTILKWFGNGGFIGWEPTTGANTLPSRWALATEGLPDPDFARATGPAFFGDSGSGVLSDDGRAVGVAVILQPSYKIMGITRLQPQLDRAAEAMGVRLRLVTASG